jgi:heme-degrading monooxygenase HmoA
VILRVWRTRINPARIDEYRRFETERFLPMLHKQSGFLAVLFLRQAEDHAASLIIWEDRGAVEAVKSSPSYRRFATWRGATCWRESNRRRFSKSRAEISARRRCYERWAPDAYSIRQIIVSADPVFREMASPSWRFIELPTGHYPMFSRPEDLAAELLDLPLGESRREDGEGKS